MSVLAFVCAVLAGSEFAVAEGNSPPPRERISLNAEWRFMRLKDETLPTGGAARTNEPPLDRAYMQRDFNDAGWRILNLPHDWGVEGPFKQEYPGETAKLPYWGIGWYRKHFVVTEADRGRDLYFDVDGAMSYAQVWLNGHYVGGWPYGYASWRLNLTPHVEFGATNVIAIRLDNPPDSSRWYPGGGIYRNVWLIKTSPVHVAHWGTQITTPTVTRDAATIRFSAEVENDSLEKTNVVATTVIYEIGLNGQKPHRVAECPPVNFAVDSHASTTAAATVIVPHPKLWSLAAPQRYLAVTELREAGRVVDTLETPFGIRTIQFTATNGFLLNGERVKIQGVCLHHDLGALGAALNARALERQLELLREAGCNAIRTSHNPPAPELLDLCDKMGFLVMDEIFDAWRLPKRTNDYHVLFDDWHEKDLRAWVQRDRNHPSVVLWSIGNEIYEQRNGTNAPIGASLARIVRQEDSTRPVNMALHVVAASTNGFQNVVDVFGYNYTPFGYAAFHSNNPSIPLIGSETASCVSSRGEYFFPVSDNKKLGRADFQASSYDLSAPSWAYAPDVEFRAQDENPFVAGELVWTGFDYLGEPTPFDSDSTNRLTFTDPRVQARMDQQLAGRGKIPVPSRSSYFGIFDLCGFRKDRFYLYQSRWRPEFPMAHILPHWNWPERIGEVTPVHVYTSGDAAELFLNGKSLGRKKKEPFQYRLRWDDVVYQPGELKVIAYKNGKKWASDTVTTTGPAAKILLSADRTTIRDDGQDLSFVTVTIADHANRLVPRSRNRVRFSITGPGEIVATDNGDATDHESFQATERNAFNGLCLVIVRAKRSDAGRIQLRAEADGLSGAEISLHGVAASSSR